MDVPAGPVQAGDVGADLNAREIIMLSVVTGRGRVVDDRAGGRFSVPTVVEFEVDLTSTSPPMARAQTPPPGWLGAGFGGAETNALPCWVRNTVLTLPIAPAIAAPAAPPGSARARRCRCLGAALDQVRYALRESRRARHETGANRSRENHGLAGTNPQLRATDIVIPQIPKQRIGRNCRSCLKLDQPREGRKLKKAIHSAVPRDFQPLYHSRQHGHVGRVHHGGNRRRTGTSAGSSRA